MYRLIYLGIVGFLFVKAFLNLDGNDWQPSELPAFISGNSKDNVLPNEEWEEALIGSWEFITQLDNKNYKGTATYKEDKTFVRKVSFMEKDGSITYKAGGTVRGTWEVTDQNTWLEEVEYCNILPDKVGVCFYYLGTLKYGAVKSDTWDYKVSHFNDSRIDIRANNLAGNSRKTYKFNKID